MPLPLPLPCLCSGAAVADARHDFTVAVDVGGLRPGCRYHYRFSSGKLHRQAPAALLLRRCNAADGISNGGLHRAAMEAAAAASWPGLLVRHCAGPPTSPAAAAACSRSAALQRHRSDQDSCCGSPGGNDICIGVLRQLVGGQTGCGCWRLKMEECPGCALARRCQLPTLFLPASCVLRVLRHAPLLPAVAGALEGFTSTTCCRRWTTSISWCTAEVGVPAGGGGQPDQNWVLRAQTAQTRDTHLSLSD